MGKGQQTYQCLVPAASESESPSHLRPMGEKCKWLPPGLLHEGLVCVIPENVGWYTDIFHLSYNF